jgi:hypothetical protein
MACTILSFFSLCTSTCKDSRMLTIVQCTLTNTVLYQFLVVKNKVCKKSGSSADFPLQGTGSCSAAGSLLTVTLGIN